MLARTKLKDAITKLYEKEQFSPSEWYKSGQSPFTDGFSPSSTWSLPYNSLNSQVWNITGQGLVMFQIEWLAVLVEDMQINPADVVFFSDHKRKTALAQGLGVKVVTDIKELLTMKFNYMLKNAPYDKGIQVGIDLPFTNIGPHSAFSVIADTVLENGGICFDVLPCNFMCLPSAKGYRNWLLENFEVLNITLWDNSQKQVFDINLSDVLTIVTRKTNKPKNNMVEWVAYNSAPFTVDLTRYEFWPMYRSPLSVPILDAVMSSKVQDIQHFNEYKQDDPKTHPTSHILSANLARVGARQNPEPHKQFVNGVLKNVGQPIWLGYSSAQEKDYQFEWMSTKHYAYVLSMVQTTPKNQPYLFSLLGEHGFANNDFYSHFKVTPTQDQEIQQWYQSIK